MTVRLDPSGESRCQQKRRFSRRKTKGDEVECRFGNDYVKGDIVSRREPEDRCGED